MPSMLAADMDAINKYMMTTPVRTAAAERVKIEWMRFWEVTQRDFLWYSQEEFDAARNLRNKFNLANTVTPEQKKAVEDTMRTGLTGEEVRGDTRRATTEGSYLEPEQSIVEFHIPTSWKVFGAIGAIALGAGWYAKKAYVDPAVKYARRASKRVL